MAPLPPRTRWRRGGVGAFGADAGLAAAGAAAGAAAAAFAASARTGSERSRVARSCATGASQLGGRSASGRRPWASPTAMLAPASAAPDEGEVAARAKWSGRAPWPSAASTPARTPGWRSSSVATEVRPARAAWLRASAHVSPSGYTACVGLRAAAPRSAPAARPQPLRRGRRCGRPARARPEGRVHEVRSHDGGGAAVEQRRNGLVDAAGSGVRKELAEEVAADLGVQRVKPTPRTRGRRSSGGQPRPTRSPAACRPRRRRRRCAAARPATRPPNGTPPLTRRHP